MTLQSTHCEDNDSDAQLEDNLDTSDDTAPVFTAPSPVPTTLSSIFRDPSGSLGRRITASDRCQSIDSIISTGTGAPEDAPIRSRVPSSAAASILLNLADKSKPPVLSLPPPPKAPPPPNSMPPPNFIPDRRVTSDGPPPRPSSPPPPELIQQATTPLLGSVLNVPGNRSIRIQGSSMPHHRPTYSNLPQQAASSRQTTPLLTLPFCHLARTRRTMAKNMKGKKCLPPLLRLISHLLVRHCRLTTTFLMIVRTEQMNCQHLTNQRISPLGPTTTNCSLLIQTSYMQSHKPWSGNLCGSIHIRQLGRALERGGTRDSSGCTRIPRHFTGVQLILDHPTCLNPVRRVVCFIPFHCTIFNHLRQFFIAYIEGVRSVLDPNPMPPGLYQYSVEKRQHLIGRWRSLPWPKIDMIFGWMWIPFFPVFSLHFLMQALSSGIEISPRPSRQSKRDLTWKCNYSSPNARIRYWWWTSTGCEPAKSKESQGCTERRNMEFDSPR